MSQNDNKQRSYMALAPLTSLAGIFINPLASTAPPLILFFLFSSSRPKVAKVALQTADLAFSIVLWIMLLDLCLMLGISINLIITNDAQLYQYYGKWIIMGIFVVSLLFALYQALNGRSCTHIFSFKIAERVFNLVNSKNSKNETNNDK
ncbi:MAG: hypothetical protein OQK75_11435 [Gammaproteobacteria bacterium]|nr:hypothetical protein [Gammaproteobacteria bacterium]MCW8988266.1 hypothetical protein [Gammaproteobacteria bacterium]MCW9030881.1 hypothetical protein [Gammaproteobacteria bacterium]